MRVVQLITGLLAISGVVSANCYSGSKMPMAMRGTPAERTSLTGYSCWNWCDSKGYLGCEINNSAGTCSGFTSYPGVSFGPGFSGVSADCTPVPTPNPTPLPPPPPPSTPQPTASPITAQPTANPTQEPTNTPTFDYTPENYVDIHKDESGARVALPAQNFGGEFTISIHVNIPVGENVFWSRLFDLGNGPASDNVVCGLGIAYSNAVKCHIFQGGSAVVVFKSSEELTLGEWTWVTLTYKNGDYKIYFGRDEVGSITTAAAASSLTRSNMWLGKSNWSADIHGGSEVDRFVINNNGTSGSAINSWLETCAASGTQYDAEALKTYMADGATFVRPYDSLCGQFGNTTPGLCKGSVADSTSSSSFDQCMAWCTTNSYLACSYNQNEQSCSGFDQYRGETNVVGVLCANCEYIPTPQPTGHPTAQPTAPTSEPTAQPTVPTSEPTAEPTVQAEIICGNANDVTFSTFYHKTIDGSYHVSLSATGTVDFTVFGKDSINIALLDSTKISDASTIDLNYSEGYEIFLGNEDEPYVHINNSFGSTPTAVAHIPTDAIHATQARDYSIEVSGSTVNIYKGLSHSDAKAVLLNHDFGDDSVPVDYAVFAYGYGDLECS